MDADVVIAMQGAPEKLAAHGGGWMGPSQPERVGKSVEKCGGRKRIKQDCLDLRFRQELAFGKPSGRRDSD